MRAHTSKVVKARFAKKNVQMLVVPGGLTPYVQAGDIGIYKSFKDKLSSITDEWKSSDRAEYTKGGNSKQPPVNDVVEWVQSAWKAVPDGVINRSAQAAGFSPLYEDWHISRHDVYGELFCRKWQSRDETSEDEEVTEDLLENLDEFTIWESEASE
ncbi:hypothetical protein PC129_g7261 [Phytophthora cactorum]|uniref:DDE-1 domain-containing protein n=2 Tax=Phytophthora cactorum TaxID=29920 RepID=A0A8T1DX73_9STRA|nr:hypothetical protein Pcac1_g17712 [Phytophthora cactorum]KAG2826971.1 hypothetical protein PC112_g9052 [Phytophthora cactorum]KAG2828959.1 hypothetical protein PC111_g7953 [Phytophthora cactorum]KAG2858870.1 hypothetical protein PC113_g9428 [Phytophthora cactorum]KAG2908015.1 hypothetical protein PC114_g10637 [Phytophthora cactorum]